MFTGIISHQGIISSTLETGQGIVKPGKVVIAVSNGFLDNIKLGDSIAVDGVCLTVIEFENSNNIDNKNYFIVEISKETIDKSGFKNLELNQVVNLERSLKFGDSIDGHLVQGHVDAVIKVFDIINIDAHKVITFIVEDLEYLKYIAIKGSVTINGVSLTVNSVDNNKFTVNLIPHSLEKTNLNGLAIGDMVNLEIDMFARYSVNYLERIKV